MMSSRWYSASTDSIPYKAWSSQRVNCDIARKNSQP